MDYFPENQPTKAKHSLYVSSLAEYNVDSLTLLPRYSFSRPRAVNQKERYGNHAGQKILFAFQKPFDLIPKKYKKYKENFNAVFFTLSKAGRAFSPPFSISKQNISTTAPKAFLIGCFSCIMPVPVFSLQAQKTQKTSPYSPER